VSRTSTAVITVMNKTTKGVVPLEPGAMSVIGDTTEFDIQNDLCSGATLAPNGKCTFKVVFKPQSPGAKSITVSFPSSNDPSSPVLVLSGNGIQ
jgi:hypothetical protein